MRLCFQKRSGRGRSREEVQVINYLPSIHNTLCLRSLELQKARLGVTCLSSQHLGTGNIKVRSCHPQLHQGQPGLQATLSQKTKNKPAHVFNFSIQKAKADSSLSLLSHPELHNETLSQNKNEKKTPNKQNTKD